MPRPWRVRYSGAKYHVTSRGNGREGVFRRNEDYGRFLEQLDDALKADQVILYAYVLMPNHYRLMVETPLGNIQRFMQRLNTAYGMYFRYKHSRPGHCFQGRYGAKLVRGDDYIVRLTRYIHLNPVKVRRFAGAAKAEKLKYLREFEWSSYRGYAGLAPEQKRINYHWLNLMSGRTKADRKTEYRQYIESMVDGKDDVLEQAMESSRYAIGDADFRDEVREELRQREMEQGETGDIVWPEARRLNVKDVEAAVIEELKVTAKDLHAHGRHAGPAKSMAIELCCRFTGLSQREIALHFGYGSESSVGKQRKRFSASVIAGEHCRKLLSRIAGVLESEVRKKAKV